jgi:hypothetical protein
MHDQTRIETKASGLQTLVHIGAMGLLTPLLDRSPRLTRRVREKGTADWDFFAAVAMTYFALSLIGSQLPAEEYDKVARLVFSAPGDALSERGEPNTVDAAVAQFEDDWRTVGPTALVDCMKFVERTAKGGADERESAQMALVGVGSWVLWNVYDGKPGPDDDELLTILGPAFLRAVAGYWD